MTESDVKPSMRKPKLKHRTMGFKGEYVNMFNFSYDILRININKKYVGGFHGKESKPNPLSDKTKMLVNHMLRVGYWLHVSPPNLMTIKEDQVDLVFGSWLDHKMYVASISPEKVKFESYFNRSNGDGTHTLEKKEVFGSLYADKESVERIMSHAAETQSGARGLVQFTFGDQFGFDPFDDFE